MDITIKPSVYSKHFKELLTNDSRYTILLGSRGSGKTFHIIFKLLLKSFESKYNHILYVNKEFRHIKTQQFADFKKVAKLHKLDKYFTFYNGDYRIINNLTGTIFTPIGMDDAEKTKGISDPTIIWWDEITKGTQEDFLTLNALLRTPLNPIHQFIISFNPVSERHWLRSYFFDKEDAYKLKDEFKDNTYLNHSTYLNNDFIDKDAYYQTLKQNAINNTNRMLVDIEGRWGIEENKNPFFYALDKNLHYTESKYQLEQNQMLYLSFDFNKNPVTLVVATIKNKEIAIVDLLTANEYTIGCFIILQI